MKILIEKMTIAAGNSVSDYFFKIFTTSTNSGFIYTFTPNFYLGKDDFVDILWKQGSCMTDLWSYFL